jgi:hypothetical protein
MTDRHPIGQLLVFRHVADLGQLSRAQRSRVYAQDLSVSGCGLVNFQQGFDGGRLARAVRAHESKDGTRRDVNREIYQGMHVTEGLGKSIGSQ